MKRQWTDGEKTLAQQPLSAPKADVKELLRGAFARWHVEKWFERAKQEAGFGAFEVRTYTSLLRHWLSSVRAMFFLASATQRLRGESPRITLEQVADVVNTLAREIWQSRPHSRAARCRNSVYDQRRNEASHAVSM